MSCEHGYLFDADIDDPFWSWTSENEWVCDQASFGPNILMAQSVGIVISTFIWLQPSDTWGRLPVLHITNFLFLASRVAMFFIYQNQWAIIVVTAIGSGFFPIGVRNGWTAVAEYTDEHGRMQLYLIGWVVWVIGAAMLGVVAWATAHWFSYMIVTSAINLLLIPFYWLTPESPRLRLTQGRIDEAEKIIRTIKKVNREEIPPNFRQELEDISAEISEDSNTGLRGLFSTWVMAKMTIVFSVTL